MCSTLSCRPAVYVTACSTYIVTAGHCRTFLLAEYSTKEILISPTLTVMKVPLEVPHNWGTARFTMDMRLLDPFFMKRRSTLDTESSRTLIVLFLTFSPELMLGSGVLAQSERVFLLFSSKLVQFSSNYFHLYANFFGTQPFLNFWERFCGPREFSSGKLALSTFWQEGFSFPDLALCHLHFFTKNAHHHDHRSHLTGFCSFACDFISPCSFTRGCIGNFNWTGLSRQKDRT